MTTLSLVPRRLTRTLPAYLAATAAATYLIFAVLAYVRYPADFSPGNNNWLSDLGNRNLNPDGADFYVWGCVTAGFILGAFFLSLNPWRTSGSRIRNLLLAAVQFAGGIAAISLVMSAIYTEDQFEAHQFWSRFISGGFAAAMFMAPFALHRAGRNSAVLIAVAATGYASIVARFVLDSAHWLEWPSIALILVFVCWVGWISATSNCGQGFERTHPVRVVGALSSHVE
jgi:peptidoglycan/LPS O-acetylase OafA/YrhL